MHLTAARQKVGQQNGDDASVSQVQPALADSSGLKPQMMLGYSDSEDRAKKKQEAL